MAQAELWSWSKSERLCPKNTCQPCSSRHLSVQTPESFRHCTCPPGRTDGNCCGGPDRSASARRFRTTLVRHCTRLSRPPRVWGTGPVRHGAQAELWRWSRSERFFLQNLHQPCSTRHPSLQSSESLGTPPVRQVAHPEILKMAENGALLLAESAPPCSSQHPSWRLLLCCGAGTTRSLCRVRDSSALVVYATPVTTMTAEKGRLLADGREVVCLRMAGRSSASGWPGGRLRADGREVVCVRTAGGRLRADGWE